MEFFTREERKRIFLSELHQLEEEAYISDKQFNDITRAHQQYYVDLRIAEEQSSKQNNSEKKPDVVITPKVKKEKRKLSAEEVRERNISWSLNLGVILLLIGGLFVATSTWETLENWSKSALIGVVSLLFFGISYLSKRVLKIEKTGFAFIVLGSLFLPIFLLSIGWFKLVGEYLSLTGEGKYVFGFISCFSLVPIYLTFAKRIASRLFVWFTYIVFFMGEGCVIASLGLEQDWFYFGMLLVNSITVLVFYQLKKRETLTIFTNEIIPFAQIQLVMTSLLMIVLFESPLINGVNLLISAALYLAMVYVSGRKEYHFIFSAMIVYGAYQLIEHSVFDVFGPVLYVLVAIGFLVLPKFLDDQFAWKKVFQLTSALVSGLVFLTISFESLVVKMNEPSLASCLAYLLLAIQFLYLTNVVDLKLLFTYLSPFFLLASLYEITLMLDEKFQFDPFIVAIFVIGFLQFMLFGWALKLRQLEKIRKSSRDLAIVTMGIAILVAFISAYWLELGIMFCLINVALFLSLRVDDRIVYKEFAPWLISIVTALAFASFGEEWRVSSLFYEKNLGLTMNAIFGSLAGYLSSIGWKRIKETHLSNHAYSVGLVFYSIAIVFALQLEVNQLWMRPIVLVGGIIAYLHFYYTKKYQWLPYVIGFLTLVAYFTLLHSIHLQVELPLPLQSIEYAFGGALLFIFSYVSKGKFPGISNGFAWVAHVYLPPALLFTFFFYVEMSIWSFIIAMVLYAFSTSLVSTEWKTKTFLYGTFTSLFLVIYTGLIKFTHGIDSSYSFMITSGLILCYWLMAHTNYKFRTMYYFVPFSIVGILSFMMSYPFSLTLFIMTVLYSIVLLVFLHIQKWDTVTIIPLLFIFTATMQYLQLAQLADSWKWSITAGIGITLILIGRTLYKQLFRGKEKVQFDSYTLVAFVFLASCYMFQPEYLWGNLVPGILISAALWLQKTRIPVAWSKWVTLAAGVYLLEPYYSLMYDLILPDLWRRELLVLPGLLVVIFLQRCLGENYRKLSNRIQWAMLVMISLSLIQDGLESNTVYDALILGTLSLISMLAGMFLKIKSYFFVGAGVLLVNVLLQTRPLWGNMPWWAYLLIAGSILISVASYYEWHKQKIARGESTLLTVLKQRIVNWFRQWN